MGQVVCGEASLSTTYFNASTQSVNFSLAGACLIQWADSDGDLQKSRSSRASRSSQPPPYLSVQLNGSIAAIDDPSLPYSGAAFMRWVLNDVTIVGGDTTLVQSLDSVDIVGFELVSFHPVSPLTPECFYRVDDNGQAPSCGGDTYYVDDNQWIAIDEVTCVPCLIYFLNKYTVNLFEF